MSGIDQQDQMLAYYPCQTKNIQMVTKIFIHIIQMMGINTHILYIKFFGKSFVLYEFRLGIRRSLLKMNQPELTHTVKDHLAIKILTKDQKGKNMRK